MPWVLGHGSCSTHVLLLQCLGAEVHEKTCSEQCGVTSWLDTPPRFQIGELDRSLTVFSTTGREAASGLCALPLDGLTHSLLSGSGQGPVMSWSKCPPNHKKQVLLNHCGSTTHCAASISSTPAGKDWPFPTLTRQLAEFLRWPAIPPWGLPYQNQSIWYGLPLHRLHSNSV